MNGSEDLSLSRSRRWLKRLEVNRAVFFSLATRTWQVFAAPITTLLIAWNFTEELRGYYGTFWNLIGLQTFAELGFQLVIIHVASHEWSRLEVHDDGSVQGDKNALARIASLFRLILVWYLGAGILFVPIVAAIGHRVFAEKSTTISWFVPWVMLVLIAGVSLCVSALVSLLEGCNQVATVQRYRLGQAITGSLIVWSLILSGGGLWVAVAASAVQLLWELYLVAVAYRRFWFSLPKAGAEPQASMSWRHDVWPLQWRIALQSVLHFLAYNLFVLNMFHYHSPELAGRMAMTWTVLTAFQGMAFTWIQVRMPTLGIFVARRDFVELDKLFFRLMLISFGVLATASALFAGGVLILNTITSGLAQRLATAFLPPLPVFIFALTIVLLHVPRCLGVYLRAHKQDPLMPLYLIANPVMALAVFLLGKNYGALASAWGFLAVAVTMILPGSILIWRYYRREWHAAG